MVFLRLYISEIKQCRFSETEMNVWFLQWIKRVFCAME